MIDAGAARPARPPRTQLYGALVGAASVAALALWLISVVAAAPLLMALGAVVPATMYAVALAYLQRGGGRPAAMIVAMLLWGATAAAVLAGTTNDLLRTWFGLFSADTAREVTATGVAPVVEEAAKAGALGLALLGSRRAIRGVRDGIVYGAAVGIGFVVAENLVYLAFAMLAGGEGGLVRAVWARGVVAGLNHAVFTATLGAGIGAAAGRAAERRGDGEPHGASMWLVAGAAAAVAQHAWWNAHVAPAMVAALCGATIVGGACLAVPAARDLFVTVPLVAAAALAPGAAALIVIYRRAGEPSAERVDPTS